MQEIYELIEEYFDMETGALISVFQNEILIYDSEIKIKIRRRALKHIVEKRKLDHYSIDKIKSIFTNLEEILFKKQFKIVKDKNSEGDTFLLIQTILVGDVGVVLALEIIIEENNVYFVKTAFFRSISKIKKLLNKNNPCGLFLTGRSEHSSIGLDFHL